MLNKIELFKTRIFHENKTYLLVSDAVKALGYVSTADFMDKYSELIVFIEQMPKLISETDFKIRRFKTHRLNLDAVPKLLPKSLSK